MTTRRARTDSDEAYVVDLCDGILRECASRQHRFDWLVGDPGRDGRSRALPVDAYYPGRRLVVEYRERQHDEPVTHFDKPDVLTVSGVHRGIQRRIYDERRGQASRLYRFPRTKKDENRSSLSRNPPSK